MTKIYDNKINIYNDFKINYIKVYGTKNKYFGSNREILSELTKLIKDFNSVELLKKLQKNDKYQFIYFNNIEGDLYDNRYSEEQDNTELPAAIYEGLLLCKLLNIINLN